MERVLGIVGPLRPTTRTARPFPLFFPAVILLGITQVLAAQTIQPLFVIERSKNANVVHYDVRIDARGLLDAKNTVDVYWILAATDGRRHELSWLEKWKAYGVDVKVDPSRESAWMTLIPLPDRSIRVTVKDGHAMTRTLIGGKPGHLERVFIQSQEGGVVPKVQYIELFGKDSATGDDLYEKIVPKD